MKVHFDDINHGDAEAEGHARVVDHVQKGFVVLLRFNILFYIFIFVFFGMIMKVSLN